MCLSVCSYQIWLNKNAVTYSALHSGTVPTCWSTSPCTLYRCSLTSMAQYHSIHILTNINTGILLLRSTDLFHKWPSQLGSAPKVHMDYNQVPCPREFQANSMFLLFTIAPIWLLISTVDINVKQITYLFASFSQVSPPFHCHWHLPFWTFLTTIAMTWLIDLQQEYIELLLHHVYP